MMTDTTDLIEFGARRLGTTCFNPAWERIEREENKRKRGKYDKKLSGLGFMLSDYCLCFHYQAGW
jgi:hypothetical protein